MHCSPAWQREMESGVKVMKDNVTKRFVAETIVVLSLDEEHC